MAKYIRFEKLVEDDFLNALKLILNLPVNKREDFDSIEAIEAEMEKAKTEGLKALRLQNRDYNYLKGQIDYALQGRMLQNPKSWRGVIACIDDAVSERPEGYPLPAGGKKDEE